MQDSGLSFHHVGSRNCLYLLSYLAGSLVVFTVLKMLDVRQERMKKTHNSLLFFSFKKIYYVQVHKEDKRCQIP